MLTITLANSTASCTGNHGRRKGNEFCTPHIICLTCLTLLTRHQKPFFVIRLAEKIKKSAKKLVRLHDNLVILVTPEAKRLGWSDRTIVKVSVVEERGEKKIVIEEGMGL